MWERQRNPNQLLSERAKNIVLSEIPITSRSQGKVRVSMASKRGQSSRPTEKENASDAEIKSKTDVTDNTFSLKSALTRSSYEFKPPAAAKYFLWDNTRIGTTVFCKAVDMLCDRVTITSGALKALRIELLKRNLIETANSTIIPGDITGYLFGSEPNSEELVLDRFDIGLKGRLPGDHMVSVLSGTFMVGDGFNYDILLRVGLDLTTRKLKNLSTPILCLIQVALSQYLYMFSPMEDNLACHTVLYNLNLDRTILPNYNLEIYPIHPLRLVNTSFSDKLLNNLEKGPSFGLMSIDQARQLYTLSKDDPLAMSIPLIGIWIKGVDSVNNKLVQNACFQYISNQKLIKLDTGKNEMLIYLFPLEKNGRLQCYECVYTLEAQCSPWELYGTENNSLFKNITHEKRFYTALERIFGICLLQNEKDLMQSLPQPREEDVSIQMEAITTPAMPLSLPVVQVLDDVLEPLAVDNCEKVSEISETKDQPEIVLEKDAVNAEMEPNLCSSKPDNQPAAVEEHTLEPPRPPVDPTILLLQNQVSALQSQLLSMASFAVNKQPHNFFHPMIFQPPLQIPKRDASTSPIPFKHPIYKNEVVQTESFELPISTSEVCVQTDIEVSAHDGDNAKADKELQNSGIIHKEEEVSSDGKNIITGLVENAEQSFIFTDKSDEESFFTSPATSVFSQPKPSVVKRLPFSRLRGSTAITEESFSRTEMLTFDDASMSFATAKYLEKYGLSP